ncbi:LamG-like jellyroll fold domain-containing protein [Spirosoma arboris]|nr:LamG-like jellyroll fold domain-containing protein [Spirosoma arboris]
MKTRQISAWVMAGMVMSTMFTACKKSDDVAALPPIGGYNTSNDVAASNLKAHWTFDGTNNEAISGTAPSNSSNASFGTGVKGQALQLSSGYLVYPTISALSSTSALPSVTVSAWINLANNNKTVSSVFALTQALTAQGDWNQGPINMYVETNAHPATSDTLQLHGAAHTYLNGNYGVGVDNVNAYGTVGTDFQIVKGINKWVHYVMVYNGSASTFDVYANGQPVSNKNFQKRTLPDGVTPVGNLTMSTPTQVVIGSMPNSGVGYTNSAVQSWQGLYTGLIDEIRVYNNALSATDIGYLYQLELAGR